MTFKILMEKEHISDIFFLEGKNVWFKESPPIITITRNPNWLTNIL